MQFKIIATYDNFMIANMALGMLEENGINCHLKDENIVTIDPLLSPAVGGIKLMVHEVQFERATMLLRDAETTYLNEVTCSYCHHKGFAIEEKTNNPASFWGKLKNQIVYGQEAVYSKQYRCLYCKRAVHDLPVSF
jgi:DNA-directed RNA polymerase subunit RPC12/RpoP